MTKEGNLYDPSNLGTKLGELVGVTVPASGDLDELNKAFYEIAERYGRLTRKFLELKAKETNLILALTDAKNKLGTREADIIAHDEDIQEGKNAEVRRAMVMELTEDELGTVQALEQQVTNMKALREMVAEAMSCLKFMKENVSRQLDIQRLEADLLGKGD